jgi:hypothetical protein
MSKFPAFKDETLETALGIHAAKICALKCSKCPRSGSNGEGSGLWRKHVGVLNLATHV